MKVTGVLSFVWLSGWLALGCGGGKGDTGGGDVPTSGDFSVLTYNVHGLPPEITGDDTAARMVDIGPLLDAYDIVGLQEDFDDDNHATLMDGRFHQTQRRFADKLEDRLYGSGLAVLADMAEQGHQHEHFDDCNGVFDGSSDCLASKGFQAVRLTFGGEAEFDLYNTHLEAGGGDEDDAARATQVDQILEMMTTWSDGRAIVFVGDTNLDVGDEDDDPLLDAIMETPGLTDACEAVGCDEPDHIDRIFFRSGGGVSIEVTEWSVEGQFVDGDGVDLSDHPAVAARVQWSVE